MEQFLIYILCLVILIVIIYRRSLLSILRKTKNASCIYINQMGYLPDESKYLITESDSSSFRILHRDSSREVFSGELTLHVKNDQSSGKTLFRGDFSDFSESGSYIIELPDGSRSFPFEISSAVFNKVRNDSIKSFYFQRSGQELKKEHAGIFARPAGHVNPLEYHKTSPLKGSRDVNGGWYDAGDYGRYITPGSVAVAIMMMGYEQYPDRFNFYNNNIPESRNGISDFLNEIRFELEWMLKMQHTEKGEFYGALPYMVNSRDYVWELPHIESQPQYIYDFSTIATADFAAVMALSARNFQNIDKTFADKCLDASLLAWDFIKDRDIYPSGGFQRPDDTETGGYAESSEDNNDDRSDRLWAAVELFLTTGEQQYNNYILENMRGIRSFSGEMTWMNTLGFAHMQYLLGNREGIDIPLQNKLKELLVQYCDDIIESVETDGFHSSLKKDEYRWGSNGELLTRAEYLIFAYLQTDNKEYFNGALNQLNYILGINGNNMSYVTGQGTKFPSNIHHAALATDGIDEPFPGLVAGGPNSRLDGDKVLQRTFDRNTPPALCYIDHVDSCASNENCITYNAPLIPVAAFFSDSHK